MDYNLGWIIIWDIRSRDVFSSQFSSNYALGKLFSSPEQITSADKYPSICSRKMEAIVLIILQMFLATRAVLKIGEYLVNKPLQAAGMSADNVRG